MVRDYSLTRMSCELTYLDVYSEHWLHRLLSLNKIHFAKQKYKIKIHHLSSPYFL